MPNPYKPLLNLLRGANVFRSGLLIAYCSGRVQVDLLSGLQPSFHSIQVSSQTQTCLHTSFSSLLLSFQPVLFTSSSSSTQSKSQKHSRQIQYNSISIYLSDSPSSLLILPFCFPPTACTEAAPGASC